ncbi:hypothetical protein GCM10025868_04460 [Angustibacter aerolatus]|uniref:Lipoprotein YerB n=1 Tax=Angustibacter aerolatus TaxID=1162965 RepID=A0ABQ6JAI4_9ACTN|nr:DUF3048 domain-containing protein [Angustibacter aerolatus]GMA85196.1 hypothetical protein GCM10025868_04460 [Angustibacter aerolatus]
MRRAALAVPAVAACLALALAGCSKDQPKAAAPTASASPSPTASATATAPARDASLLSGRKGRRDGSVYAVKIDNTHSAHPQVGVDAADVVYVEEVEGGLTRLAAVFSSTYPKQVGPVRSGRISDIRLLRQYGEVGLIYSGSQRKMIAPLQRSSLHLVSFDANGKGFSRASGRPAPYNVIGDFATLRARAGKTSVPSKAPYAFGPAPAGGKAATHLSVRWPGAHLTATWSKSAERWLVSMDGSASRTPSGKRLGPQTFIVQRVKVVKSKYVDVNRNPTPDSKTVGSGSALVLRDGRVYDAKWSRASDDDITHWTIGGKEAVLSAGQVWVALAGTTRTVSVR